VEEYPDYLDQEYGPAIEPQNGGIKAWEKADGRILPIALNRITGKWLTDLLHAADQSPLALKAIQAVTVLWAIDEAGDLYFALEEVIDTVQNMAQRPKMRGIALNDQVKPLGHPLLVGCGKGRISGEILVDGVHSDLRLAINNRSGRYGRHASRTRQHLENVVLLFSSFGVTLQAEFFG
jgi:hypothetical protein